MQQDNKKQLVSYTKKPRKVRSVKNATVDIEDVKIDSGLEYINWRHFAEIKLKEREITLLQKRLKICDQIIISAIIRFSNQNRTTFGQHNQCHIYVDRMKTDNFAVYNQIRTALTDNNSSIMQECNASITQELSHWKGYNPNKRKPKNAVLCQTFRDYFQNAKHWYDVKKIKTITNQFFIPIINIIHKFTQKAATEFFCNRLFRHQTLYSKYLYALILKGLLEGMMQIPNTRPLYLIPAQCYSFFTVGNDTNLKVSDNKTRRDCNHNQKRTVIRAQTVQLVNAQYTICKKEFEETLLQLHYEVDNYHFSNANASDNVYYNNYNNTNNYCNNTNCNCLPAYSPIPMPMHMAYTNHKGSNVRVKDKRHSPLLPYNSNIPSAVYPGLATPVSLPTLPSYAPAADCDFNG